MFPVNWEEHGRNDHDQGHKILASSRKRFSEDLQEKEQRTTSDSIL